MYSADSPKKGQPGYKRAKVKRLFRRIFQPKQLVAERTAEAKAADKAAAQAEVAAEAQKAAREKSEAEAREAARELAEAQQAARETSKAEAEAQKAARETSEAEAQEAAREKSEAMFGSLLSAQRKAQKEYEKKEAQKEFEKNVREAEENLPAFAKHYEVPKANETAQPAELDWMQTRWIENQAKKDSKAGTTAKTDEAPQTSETAPLDWMQAKIEMTQKSPAADVQAASDPEAVDEAASEPEAVDGKATQELRKTAEKEAVEEWRKRDAAIRKEAADNAVASKGEMSPATAEAEVVEQGQTDPATAEAEALEAAQKALEADEAAQQEAASEAEKATAEKSTEEISPPTAEQALEVDEAAQQEAASEAEKAVEETLAAEQALEVDEAAEQEVASEAEEKVQDFLTEDDEGAAPGEKQEDTDKAEEEASPENKPIGGFIDESGDGIITGNVDDLLAEIKEAMSVETTDEDSDRAEEEVLDSITSGEFEQAHTKLITKLKDVFDLAPDQRDTAHDLGVDTISRDDLICTAEGFQSPARKRVSWVSSLLVRKGEDKCSIKSCALDATWTSAIFAMGMPTDDVPHLILQMFVKPTGITLLIDFVPRNKGGYVFKIEDGNGEYPEPDSRETFKLAGVRKLFNKKYFTESVRSWRAGVLQRLKAKSDRPRTSASGPLYLELHLPHTAMEEAEKVRAEALDQWIAWKKNVTKNQDQFLTTQTYQYDCKYKKHHQKVMEKRFTEPYGIIFGQSLAAADAGPEWVIFHRDAGIDGS